MYAIEETVNPFVGQVELTDLKENPRTFRSTNYFEYQLYQKIKNGFSPTIVICGERRIGKSFIALYLAYTYCRVMSREFNFREFTFYEPLKVIQKLETFFKMPIIIDEASDIMDFAEWWTETQKALRSVLNTQAYRGIVYIFISPFVSDLSPRIKKHFDFNLHVTARGRLKSYKYVKRFKELDQKKSSYPFFLDDLSLAMRYLPEGIYSEYEKYSISEKEKIRKRHQEKMENEVNPVIKNMLNAIRGAYSG